VFHYFWPVRRFVLIALIACAAASGNSATDSAQIGRIANPGTLPPPSALRDHVVDGKLRLTLEDAVRLTLLNNPDVRIARSPVDSARYSVLAAYGHFDPVLTANGQDQRSISQPDSLLQGVGLGTITGQNVNSLFQTGAVGYSQTFATGTDVQVNFSGAKNDTNNSFFFFNPYLTAGLNLQVTQPLIRNRGFFPNRAPIRIAQRGLRSAQDAFEAQVNTQIQQTINQYWNVVLARESLHVAEESVRQAQATYDHDRRALELGALPPLNIYRSESTVAQRRVSEIQAEYALKQAEDAFRQVIGGDLDPNIAALDLDLVEDPTPQAPLFSIDEGTAMLEARQHRTEFASLNKQLAADDMSIRLARNQLLPEVDLQGIYFSQGLGGIQYNTLVTPVVVIPGGFGDALSQVFHFNYPTYSLGLTFNFPIRNRAARAALGQAAVTKRNDLYQMRREEQAVNLDVKNAVHSLEQAKLSMSAAKIARDLAQKTVESEQRKYELGSSEVYVVLEAQTELATAEVTLVQSQINYQMALAAVDHATGTLLERHQVEIENALRQP
jgi:outer membrane protein